MGIGPNKVYSYSSVTIIGFLPLASFLIFGAQWSHLALFCQNPVFLLSDGRIPDSHAFWVMTSRTFSFLGGGGISLLSFVLFFNFQYLSGRPSLMCLFDTAHFEFLIEIFKNFCNADCRTLHIYRNLETIYDQRDQSLLRHCGTSFCCKISQPKLDISFCNRHEFGINSFSYSTRLLHYVTSLCYTW